MESGARPIVDDLFDSVKHGQMKLASKILSQSPHYRDVSKNGISILEFSLSYGNTSVVQQLLCAGIASSGISLTSIFSCPHYPTIHKLLESTTTISLASKRGHDKSYLEAAILTSQKDIRDLALSLDPSHYDSGALCAAVVTGVKLEQSEISGIVQELVKRRDNLSRNDVRIDAILENTAVSLAAYFGQLDILMLLLSNERIPPHQQFAAVPEEGYWDFMHYHPSILSLAEENVITRHDVQDWTGWHTSPWRRICTLFLAVKAKNEREIDHLLESGYLVDGLTLQSATKQDLSDTLVLKLAEKCYDIDAKEADTFTPLHNIVIRGRTALSKQLLAKGANPSLVRNSTDGTSFFFPGFTPLACAVKSGDINLIQHLLQIVDVNQRITTDIIMGQTALTTAIYQGYIGVVKLLLDHGADPNHRRFPKNRYDICGTPLEVSAGCGRLDITQLLLDYGASTDGYKRVQFVHAVHIAEEHGYEALVQLLMNYREWTAEDYAIYSELVADPVFSHIHQVFIHPKEYSVTELAEVVRNCERSRVSSSCELTYWRGNSSTWSTLEPIIRRFSLEVERENTGVRPDSRNADWPSSQPGSSTISETAVVPEPPEGAEGVLDLDKTIREEFNELNQTSVEGILGRDVPASGITTHNASSGIMKLVSPDTEAEDDERAEILRDMMGINEAPVRATVWRW
ncbi:ankyrin [Thozetella sp. PMI_491]|nr:ankyrin [Thozetella sp. PMI_491]